MPKAKKKILIGLTGGFSTGKSTIRVLFQEFGAKTFDCDEAAHKSLKKNTATYKKIVKAFGRDILTKDQIDRKKLGAIVFRNKTKRKKLESIIHPFVRREMKAFAAKKKGILVFEVPLLFESRLQKVFDVIVVVSATEKEIIKRAKKKFKGLSVAGMKRRIRSQLPLSFKRKKADFIVKNDSPKKVVRRVKEIMDTLVRLSS